MKKLTDPAFALAVKFDALTKSLEEWQALPHDTEDDDERGEAIYIPLDAVFDQMEGTPATSIDGILGKLRVAVHFLERDWTRAPALVEAAMNDLAALAATKPRRDPVADAPVAGAPPSLSGDQLTLLIGQEAVMTEVLSNEVGAGGAFERWREIDRLIINTRASNFSGLIWKLSKMEEVIREEDGVTTWVKEMAASVVADAAHLSTLPSVPVLSGPADPVADIGPRIVNAVNALVCIDEMSSKHVEKDATFLAAAEKNVDQVMASMEQYALSHPATTPAGAMVQCCVAMGRARSVGEGPRKNETTKSLSSDLEFALYSILGVLETVSGIDRDTIGGNYHAPHWLDPAAKISAAMGGTLADLLKAA
jgi:hypothetical protein